MSDSTRIAFVAGEASGDLLSAGILAELRRRIADLQSFGVGGDRMIATGFDAWEHIRALSVRGYTEVLRHLPRLLKLRSSLADRLIADPPALFVGVDAPDFNLGLEERLRARGIKTVHYVSPSIWGWRPERIEQIRRAVDHMLLVFPFEQAIYDRAGIPATFVGHPLASMIPRTPDRDAARTRLGLELEGTVVALLPGSRPDEIRHLGATFVETAALLRRREPTLRFLLPMADPMLAPALRSALAALPELGDSLRLIDGRSHDCLEASDVVLVASGTATLEAALYQRPMVIAYKTPWLTAWIMRRKGRIPFAGLPNILAGERLVPELLQERATPAALAAEVADLLNDPARRSALKRRFAQLHDSLARDTPALAADVIVSVARR